MKVSKKIRSDLDWIAEQMRSYIEREPEPIIQIENLQHELRELADQFSRKWGLPVDFLDQMPDFTYGSLSKFKMAQLYYIVQEALWNAFKHSKASLVRLIVRSTMTSLTISVTDNGVGFDTGADESEQHYGLKNMEDRASSIKGKINIKSNQNGTSVTISVPWEEISDE